MIIVSIETYIAWTRIIMHVKYDSHDDIASVWCVRYIFKFQHPLVFADFKTNSYTNSTIRNQKL